MSFLTQLFMSRADRLKAKGDIHGLVESLGLRHLGGTESEKHCKQAVAALAELGQLRAQVKELLTRMLQNNTVQKADLLSEVITSLGHITGLRPIEAQIAAHLLSFEYSLFAIRKDECHVAIRKSCAETLRTLPRTAIRPVVDFLCSSLPGLPSGGVFSSSGIYAMRVELLGEFGDPAAVEPLGGLLNFSWAGWSNRAAAARALGKIGGDRATAILEKAKKDISDPWVREDIFQALERLGRLTGEK